jgi:hypothetical protein
MNKQQLYYNPAENVWPNHHALLEIRGRFFRGFSPTHITNPYLRVFTL